MAHFALFFRKSDFAASDSDGLIEVHITFGIKGVDRSDVKTFDGKYYGDIVWDNDFSMWSTEAQDYLWSTCQELQNSSLVYEPPNSEFVKCPIEEWKVYLHSMNESFPYDADSESDFAAMWQEFLESDYAEDTVGNRLSYAEEDDGGDYTVRFYAMFAELPAGYFTTRADDAKQYRDDYDDLIAEIKADCPDNLCDSVGNAAWKWSDLATEGAFITSALNGMALALPLAFVVLLISTRNWIISVFAMMDILGVVSCELCVMWMFGWKFGSTEAIAIIMVIGFSVGMLIEERE